MLASNIRCVFVEICERSNGGRGGTRAQTYTHIHAGMHAHARTQNREACAHTHVREQKMIAVNIKRARKPVSIIIPTKERVEGKEECEEALVDKKGVTIMNFHIFYVWQFFSHCFQNFLESNQLTSR